MSGYPDAMDLRGPAGDEARRAWRRIFAGTGKRPAGAATGERSLETLADISTIRRVLEQAELSAVRTARACGKPWAEIATNLGVTRQSAWERWHELDDGVTVTASSPTNVTVPDVIGMSCDDGRRALADVGLVAVRHNPGGEPTPLVANDAGVIVDQVPSAGARRRSGSSVAVWTSRGGESGVREPRRPQPTPRRAVEEAVAQATEELVGSAEADRPGTVEVGPGEQ
jgi:hypothetical protein